ncbi:MAG: hypothetical protein WAU28_00740 [Candidatus Moraniibacteriota bacterium]
MTEIVIEGDGSSPSTAECQGTECPRCSAHAEGQEMAFAFLLALMPVISLTLFGQAGLL